MKRCKNKPSLEEAILFFPEKERDAPSILKYKPTYQGFIRQKGKKPVETEEPIQQAKTAELTQQEEKLEEVIEDSFGEIPKFLRLSIQRPLRGKIREAREDTTDKEGEEIEMAPRNILADLKKRKKEREEAAKAKTTSKTGPQAGGPSIRSTRSKGPSIQVPDSPTGKRPHSSTSQDKEVPKDTRAEKKQRTTEVGSGGEGETTKGKGVAGSAVPWRPLFVTPAPEKHQITNEDSLAADPSIARVLYHGLALPKDITMPASLKSAIDDHYFHAGRAMQSMMQAQLYIADIDRRTKAQQLLAERYKKQLDGSELERRKLAEQVTNLNEMVKQLSGATEQARAEGKKEMEKEMREEMEKEKKKAFDEGYSRGYDKAGDELVDQVEQAKIVFKQQQHAESYTLGYCKALDDAGLGGAPTFLRRKAGNGSEHASPEEEGNSCQNLTESWPLGVLPDKDPGLTRARRPQTVGSVRLIPKNKLNFHHDQHLPSAAFGV
ncbi:hypothetical protein RHGRI_024814 [Rhododendron griersonianum]|uniref:Uncharacterized protein n=1 Tax=Rhododendron griersonianum TaxID=479676 RepID=A0AAV6J9T8_9ERIC|nr:hypothetical protein RHGRI_024814 [Rhododendron griersonianum]